MKRVPIGGRVALLLVALMLATGLDPARAGTPAHDDAGKGVDASDSKSTPTNLPGPGRYEGRLYAGSDDHDWYQFSIGSVGDPKGRPTIEVFLLSRDDVNFGLELYAPGAGSATATGVGSAGSRLVRHSADVDGNWILHLSSGGGSAKTGTYEFALRILNEDDANADRDAPEDGDTSTGIVLAPLTGFGLSLPGELVPGDTGDLYNFVVTDSGAGILATLHRSDATPVSMSLIPPGSAIAIGETDREGPAFESIYVPSPPTGTWGLRVAPDDDGLYGSYHFSVVSGPGNRADLGTGKDATNGFNAATAFPPGMSTGTLSSSNDLVDSYDLLGVSAGDVLRIGASSYGSDPVSRPRVVVSLFAPNNPDAARVQKNVCDGSDGITLTADQGGTWHLRVSEARDIPNSCGGLDTVARSGPYAVLYHRERQPDLSPGDAPASAGAATAGPDQPYGDGWLDEKDSTDVYRLGTIPIADEVHAFLASTSPLLTIKIRLVDTEGNTLSEAAAAPGGGARLHAIMGRQTGYFLIVQNDATSSPAKASGAYRLWSQVRSDMAPSPVTLATPSDSGTTRHSINITWTASRDTDFQRYEVHMSQSPGFTPTSQTLMAAIPTRTRTTYDAKGLDSGTSYTFIVRVFDQGGLMAESNRRTGTTESGLVGSNPPSLSNGGVDPDEGNPSTLFNFKVTYTDPDNDAPATRRVFIDGAPRDMSSSDATFVDGAVFSFQTTLGAGEHSFFFEFSDGEYPPVRDPVTGAHSGPIVTGSGNRPPTVTADGTPDQGEAPLTVQFTATASDPDQDSLSYAWDFDNSDGFQADASGREPKHTYQGPGFYTATVRVTDPKGATSTDSVSINVRSPSNQAPITDPTAEPASGTAPLRVQFRANAKDNDGTIQSYSWDFDNANGIQRESSDANPSHTYVNAGTYVATLTVEDGEGAEATGSVVVTVRSEGNRPPNLLAQASPESGSAPLTVTFTANALDPDNDQVTVTWDFDLSNGIQEDATGVTATYTYTGPGTYSALAIARDTQGATATASATVEVLNPEPGAPALVFIEAEPQRGKAPLSVQFRVNASGLTSPITLYAWDFGDGSPVDTTATPNHTFEKKGRYDVGLNLTDADGIVHFSSIEIRADGAKGSPAPSTFLVIAVLALAGLLARRGRRSA